MQHLEQFHREAVNKNLSAGAILLWQQLYFTMERKNQFADLPLNTAVLTAQLKVSRQGLALMRQALADNGLLAVRVDEHQQTFYTLMLNGKAVGAPDTHSVIIPDAHIVSSRPEARQSRSGEIYAAPKDFSTSVLCTFARNDKVLPSGRVLEMTMLES